MIAIVFAYFAGTTIASGTFRDLKTDVLSNVHSYLPAFERTTSFRCLNRDCNQVYLEQNDLDGVSQLKGYLNQIHDDWITWNAQKMKFKRKIRKLHCRVSAEEQYALQSPRIFRKWMDKMLGAATVFADARSKEDPEPRQEIVRRVFKAVRLRPFHPFEAVDQHSARWAAYRNLDPFTQELIRFSRRLYMNVVASCSTMQRPIIVRDHGMWRNIADLKWPSLRYQHLWDRISARNGSLLPPRNTVFQIQNEAQCQYLKHLVTDCGLAVIHPMYLDYYLDHKVYWHQMDTARDKWESYVVAIEEYSVSNPAAVKDIWGMFRQKYVIMAMQSMRYDGDGIGQFQRWREVNQQWLNDVTQCRNIKEEDDLAQQLSRELMYW